ncbi:MAG TPA: inositol monophosphatase family protein [Urbifossiella sp.]|jgi:3'(2'), 5'-bisphosphate nucleotidase|nr:inositol monophosphatase family protein [Urbifossiella sp.]
MSSPLDLGDEINAALEAAEQASALVRREYATFAAIPDAPASISTHVDKASQELILEFLHARFPADALCAEESTPGLAKVPHTGSRVWVVDPIDGTRGFAKKTGQFSVMIGLLLDGEPVVGVVAEPAIDRTTYAWTGGGCWYKVGDGTSVGCHVSRRKLKDAVLTQSWAKPGQPSRPVRALAPSRVVETYSGGVKLAQVARGEADVYANVYETFFDWDICAGHVLVTEAGGRVTDLSGNPVAYAADRFAQTRGLLATNGAFHDDAVRLLAAVPA